MFLLLPRELWLKAIKKLNNVTFPKIYRSCKLLKHFIDENAKHITIYSEKRVNLFSMRMNLWIFSTAICLELLHPPYKRHRVVCRSDDFKEKLSEMIRLFHLQFFIIESVVIVIEVYQEKDLNTLLSVFKAHSVNCYSLSTDPKHFLAVYDVLKPQHSRNHLYCFKDEIIQYNSNLYLDYTKKLRSLTYVSQCPSGVLFYLNHFGQLLDGVHVAVWLGYERTTSTNCDIVLSAFLAFFKRLLSIGYRTQPFRFGMRPSERNYSVSFITKPFYDYLGDIDTLSIFSHLEYQYFKFKLNSDVYGRSHYNEEKEYFYYLFFPTTTRKFLIMSVAFGNCFDIQSVDTWKEFLTFASLAFVDLFSSVRKDPSVQYNEYIRLLENSSMRSMFL